MALRFLKLHVLHETDNDLKAMELNIPRAVILLYVIHVKYVISSVEKYSVKTSRPLK